MVERNIALIGFGRIGERHLESLLTLDDSYKIQVYDKFLNSPVNNIKAEFVKDIDDLNDSIDVCIVATKSNVRKQVVEDLLEKKTVKFLILEKVAFQSIDDFMEVISLVDSKQITCYVNCPMRIQPIYKKVGDLLELKSPTKFTYEYSEAFKISSSFIHILDLFCYLCGEYNIEINSHLTGFKDSVKHNGFVDFEGSLSVETPDGHTLHLEKGSNKFTEVLRINNNEIDIYTREGGSENDIDDDRVGKVIFNNEDSYSIPFLWQSFLTAEYVKQVTNSQDCGLPLLKESFLIHRPMLNCFNEFLSKSTKKKVTTCPIT
tara:strand:+ start:1330 stop:2283 length:954 start_codon:yes stop_codon:yes gene_type:complete